MRCHIFKSTSQRKPLTADSQGTPLIFHNFNILSLPGAGIRNVNNFISSRNKCDIIVLLIGNNDLAQRKSARYGTPPPPKKKKEVALEFSVLANCLLRRAGKIYVIGIPHLTKQRIERKRKQKRGTLGLQRNLTIKL